MVCFYFYDCVNDTEIAQTKLASRTNCMKYHGNKTEWRSVTTMLFFLPSHQYSQTVLTENPSGNDTFVEGETERKNKAETRKH